MRVVAPTSVNGGRRETDRRRRRTLADDDVELEVLHRRVEDLLDDARQSVDLVDEQHVAVAELGEDRGQVAGTFERRTGGDVHVHAHLDGDDAGQAGLAEPGRAGQQQVVGRLAAHLGCLEHDREMLFQLALTDELAQPSRPQPGLVGLFDVVGRAGIEELLTHVGPPTGAERRAACLRPTPTRAARASRRGSLPGA